MISKQLPTSCRFSYAMIGGKRVTLETEMLSAIENPQRNKLPPKTILNRDKLISTVTTLLFVCRNHNSIIDVLIFRGISQNLGRSTLMSLISRARTAAKIKPFSSTQQLVGLIKSGVPLEQIAADLKLQLKYVKQVKKDYLNCSMKLNKDK